MHRHAETWARRNLDPEGKHHVFIHDVTGAYSQLNIQGNQSSIVIVIVIVIYIYIHIYIVIVY